MLGGYSCYLAVTLLGLPPIFGVFFAIAILMAVGMLVEQALIKPIHDGKVDRPDEYAIMITFSPPLWGRSC